MPVSSVASAHQAVNGLLDEARAVLQNHSIPEEQRITRAKQLIESYLSQEADPKNALARLIDKPHLRQAAIPLWNQRYADEKIPGVIVMV